MHFEKYDILKERCSVCQSSGATAENCKKCEYKQAIKKYENVNFSSKSDGRMTTYEKTRHAVYATGNKWAIENFHATHD